MKPLSNPGIALSPFLSLSPTSLRVSSYTDGEDTFGMTRSMSQSLASSGRIGPPGRARSRPYVFSSFLEENSTRRFDQMQPLPSPPSMKKSQTLPTSGRYKAPALSAQSGQNLPPYRAPSPILVGHYDSEPRWGPTRSYQRGSHRQRAESVDTYAYARIK